METSGSLAGGLSVRMMRRSNAVKGTDEVRHPLLVSLGNKPRRGLVKACAQCGEEFYVKRAAAMQKYCSYACLHKGMRKARPWPCKNCGAEYYRSPAQVRWRGSRFCSRKCFGEWQSKHERGEKNRNWRGGRIRVSRMDHYFSLYIRARDAWRCQWCGKQYSRGSLGLHCSHFIGRGHQATRFDPDNCIALCYGHHRWLETYKVTHYQDFMRKRLGEEAFRALLSRGAQSVHRNREDWAALSLQLRDWLDDVGIARESYARARRRKQTVLAMTMRADSALRKPDDVGRSADDASVSTAPARRSANEVARVESSEEQAG